MTNFLGGLRFRPHFEIYFMKTRFEFKNLPGAVERVARKLVERSGVGAVRSAPNPLHRSTDFEPCRGAVRAA